MHERSKAGHGGWLLRRSWWLSALLSLGAASCGDDGQGAGTGGSSSVTGTGASGSGASSSSGAGGAGGQGGGSTEPAATILASLRWTHATGSSVEAFTDGDPSRNVWCDPSTIAPVVYPASDAAAGWSGPGNVLSFQNTTAGCGGVQLTQVFPVPEAGAHWCWRYYYKQDEGQAFHHHHGLGDLNPVGSIDLVFHQVSSGQNGSFGHGLGMNPSDFGWWAFTEPGGGAQRDFAAQTWYRFEMNLEWVSVSGPPNTWRYRVRPRVYDASGTLLADARHYRADYIDGQRVDRFLDDFYASGGSAVRNSSGDDGFESIRNYYHGIAQSKASSTGRVYYAAVDVGLCAGPEAFIGPAN